MATGRDSLRGCCDYSCFDLLLSKNRKNLCWNSLPREFKLEFELITRTFNDKKWIANDRANFRSKNIVREIFETLHLLYVQKYSWNFFINNTITDANSFGDYFKRMNLKYFISLLIIQFDRDHCEKLTWKYSTNVREKFRACWQGKSKKRVMWSRILWGFFSLEKSIFRTKLQKLPLSK